MIKPCSGCNQVSGETNQVDEKKQPFFLCVKCEAESESVDCCQICSRPINEEKEDFEQTDIYMSGNYDDTVFVHTDCRYKNEQMPKLAIEKRIKDLEKRIKNWTNNSRAGSSAYSIVLRELEVLKDVKELLEGNVVEGTGNNA